MVLPAKGYNGVSYAFIAVALLIYAWASIIGVEAVLPSQVNDELTVMTLAQDPRSIEGTGGGYYYMALLAAQLPTDMIDLLVAAVGILFIFQAFKGVRTTLGASVVLFLVIPPILLFLTIFIKEIFTPLLTLAVIYAFRMRTDSIKYAIIAAIYIIYGLFFRQYFLLIIVTFLALSVFSNTDRILKVTLVVAFVACLLIIPDYYFFDLQVVRDNLNSDRLISSTGSRTAFTNLVPPGGVMSFLINYVYAAAVLNVPIAFLYFGPKEAALTVTAMVYAALTIISLRSGNSILRGLALLFASHVAVQLLFEPDLGSYLRHSSALLLYLTPAIPYFEMKWRQAKMAKRRARKHPALSSTRIAGRLPDVRG